ncbi:MAG: GlxA family transcriptional regulator [Kiloniellales bacterium]
MFDGQSPDGPERLGFLLVPGFSMIGFFSAIEPLRVANRLKGRQLYSWRIFSLDGEPVAASNGMTIVADASISQVERFPTVIVCASYEPERYLSKRLLAWLRRLDRQGARLGALETGAHVLARAGLLDGYRATLHWESAPAFAEKFPTVEVSHELFEIDRKRITCSGGTAAIDLMLHLMAGRHGQQLALDVSEQLLHARIRNPDDHQRMALGQRLGVRHPKLIRIVEAMEENLEEPLRLDGLSALGGISRRQLERLFRNHLADTPSGYYLKLRLYRARQFLEQTDMSVLDVSLACGFISAPYFSRAYRALFGRAPRDDRRNLRLGVGRTGWFMPGAEGLDLL